MWLWIIKLLQTFIYLSLYYATVQIILMGWGGVLGCYDYILALEPSHQNNLECCKKFCTKIDATLQWIPIWCPMLQLDMATGECDYIANLSLTPSPVDKNRSTTGGQSGPPYLQLWLQQEDSPDHASWESSPLGASICHIFCFDNRCYGNHHSNHCLVPGSRAKKHAKNVACRGT